MKFHYLILTLFMSKMKPIVKELSLKYKEVIAEK